MKLLDCVELSNECYRVELKAASMGENYWFTDPERKWVGLRPLKRRWLGTPEVEYYCGIGRIIRLGDGAWFPFLFTMDSLDYKHEPPPTLQELLFSSIAIDEGIRVLKPGALDVSGTREKRISMLIEWGILSHLKNKHFDKEWKNGVQSFDFADFLELQVLSLGPVFESSFKNYQCQQNLAI